MKHYFVTTLLLFLTAAISGCNTTRGVGQDIEATGEKIEELAEDAQDKFDNDDS